MVRFLSSLSGEEKNRDVFGTLRGRCVGCNKNCSEFKPGGRAAAAMGAA